MAFDFPWEMFLQAQQQRNAYTQNAVNQAAQAIQSIGGNVGDYFQRKRMMDVMGNVAGQDFMQNDPIAKAMAPLSREPAIYAQILPTLLSGAYKARAQANKPGQTMDTLYLDKKNNRYSRVPKPGFDPQVFPQYQAAQIMGRQDTGDATKSRFDQLMGLNTGKAANMIDLNEGKLVDDTQQLKGLLNGLQVEHAQLYPQFGGMVKGKATRLVSGLTGGTSSYSTPFGDIPIPYSDPKVAAFNSKVDGLIQQLSPFLKEKGRLSDNDVQKRLEPLKALLNKDPNTVSKLYGDLNGLLDAIQSNDISRANRAYARLGIKTRIKPNVEAQQQLNQKQILGAMMMGNQGMNPASLQPNDLGSLSTEQLQQLMSQAEDE